jgi:hypothetical protein
MTTLTPIATDHRMRAFRLATTPSRRPLSIHEIVRSRAEELHRSSERRRPDRIDLPWIATR